MTDKRRARPDMNRGPIKATTRQRAIEVLGVHRLVSFALIIVIGFGVGFGIIFASATVGLVAAINLTVGMWIGMPWDDR